MDNAGFNLKKKSSAGGVIRRVLIFLLVAGAVGAGIYSLFPHQEKAVEPPAAEIQPTPAAIPVAASVPEVQPDPVVETLAISAASQSAPVPADDPEVMVEKKPELPAAVPAEEEPVRKGIVHPTDPADEAPYSAPDLVPVAEFETALAAVRAAGTPEAKRTLLMKLLKETAFSSPQYRVAAKMLNDCTRDLKTGSSEKTLYVVKPGDSLIRLARKFHLPTARLAAENGLEATALLKIGQKLQVPAKTESWSVRISKRARLLRVFCGGELFAVYDVGIGRKDRTPEGTFILRETVDDPPYPLPEGGMAKAGSPENQLGPCWLGLGDSKLRPTGYGIHGTPDEASVTRNLSAGCVRMRNKEVLELRSRIPVGTPVVIEN